MSCPLIGIAALLGAALVCVAVTGCLAHGLRTRGILELPNDRSLHVAPVPTGGGWAVLSTALVFWLFLIPTLDAAGTTLLVGILALAFISWIDDLRPMSPLYRLVAHALTVVACLAQIDSEVHILWTGLPFWLDRVLVGLGWVWFINLFNFMDGIDGLAGIETITITLGFFIISQFIQSANNIVLLSAVLAGSAGGFLIWNWQPAKIILGDVGAIPIGFILGWVLISLALQGHLVAAVILPLYYAMDATITLVKRILGGKRFWTPHQEHFYQSPIKKGFSHSQVVLRIIPANALLVGSAILSIYRPIWGLALGTVVVFGLLIHLSALARR